MWKAQCKFESRPGMVGCLCSLRSSSLRWAWNEPLIFNRSHRCRGGWCVMQRVRDSGGLKGGQYAIWNKTEDCRKMSAGQLGRNACGGPHASWAWVNRAAPAHPCAPPARLPLPPALCHMSGRPHFLAASACSFRPASTAARNLPTKAVRCGSRLYASKKATAASSHCFSPSAARPSRYHAWPRGRGRSEAGWMGSDS